MIECWEESANVCATFKEMAFSLNNGKGSQVPRCKSSNWERWNKNVPGYIYIHPKAGRLFGPGCKLLKVPATIHKPGLIHRARAAYTGNVDRMWTCKVIPACYRAQSNEKSEIKEVVSSLPSLYRGGLTAALFYWLHFFINYLYKAKFSPIILLLTRLVAGCHWE